MSNSEERFELFLSYMSDRTSLTSEQIQGIEERLTGCRFLRPPYLPETGPEDAERIKKTNIFKNGEIRASVNPSTRLLSVQNLECFLTEILIAIHSQDLPINDPDYWLEKHRRKITDDLKEDFDRLLMQWVLLEKKLTYFGLMRKSRKIIRNELSKLEEGVLSKIPNHKFPKGTLSRWVENSSRVDLIDRLIKLFETYLPELKDDPMSHRISELLGAFSTIEKPISAPPGTIRQRMTRAKAQPE